MSYRLLTRESMVSLSEPLVDENHADCRALRADPIGAALWPFIVAAHLRLLALQRVVPSPQRLDEIIKLEAWYDGLHDDLIRGIWYLFLGVEFLREQPEDRERFKRLRDKLLPAGLSSTQRTYRDQSGQAKLAESRLDAADWELMRRMPLPDGSTLADAVERWFALAAKLGELENERDGHVSVQQPTSAEILAARNGWIRAMRTLYDALTMRDDLPESLQIILRRLDEVIARAVRRRNGQGNGNGNDAEPGPGGDSDIDSDIDIGLAPDSAHDDIDTDIVTQPTPGNQAAHVVMAGQAIESPIPQPHTGARGGRGA